MKTKRRKKITERNNFKRKQKRSDCDRIRSCLGNSTGADVMKISVNLTLKHAESKNLRPGERPTHLSTLARPPKA